MIRAAVIYNVGVHSGMPILPAEGANVQQALFAAIMTIEKQTILVVDDEAIDIQIVSEILDADYEVICALNGRDGIRLACEAVPDLILLDVQMPDMSGYEVCSFLSADPRTVAIPVIFVTGMDSTIQEIQGLEAGAVDYITKPLRPQVVKARVRNHLEFKRKMQHSYLSEPTIDAEAEGITPRQKQILEWIQAGKTNGEIATIIASSQANVKYHVSKIMEKLNVHNRAQLVAKAVSLHLIRLKK